VSVLSLVLSLVAVGLLISMPAQREGFQNAMTGAAIDAIASMRGKPGLSEAELAQQLRGAKPPAADTVSLRLEQLARELRSISDELEAGRGGAVRPAFSEQATPPVSGGNKPAGQPDSKPMDSRPGATPPPGAIAPQPVPVGATPGGAKRIEAFSPEETIAATGMIDTFAPF